ncbi:MAG: acetylornithine transaminase [Clostridia bacterium]|nr:acetylornithine transaminase [Clostridia bacterium]
MGNYARSPVAIVRGRGARVWDAEGRAYLDFVAGISVHNVGHCHPRVVQAVCEQAAELCHASNLYHTGPQVELAEALCRLAFPARVFFCQSGAEANEAAIKLARKWAWRRGEPGRYKIVSFHNGFHGRTLGALAATGTPRYQEGFGPMPEGFQQVPYNDLEAAARVIDDRTAAVLVEAVQGEGGVIPAAPGFLEGLRGLCDRAGALLILDEIQTGIGRTGQMWAYQHAGIQPDVMTLAKALGGGLPLGAVLARAEVAEALQPGDHGTTFGGNPVSCRAACAVLDVLEEEGLVERAARMGELLRGRLEDLRRRHPAVQEVRGRGLMIGIQVALPARNVVAAAQERGLLANFTSSDVIRLLPPLVIGEKEVEEAVAILDEALTVASER